MKIQKIKRLFFKTLWPLTFFTISLNCYSFQVAKAPILFQGSDDVPLDAICLKDIGQVLLSSVLHECTLKIKEYAGQKVNAGSNVAFDPTNRKVANINFKFDLGAYENVKAVLTEKYGQAQLDKSTDAQYWYGDKDGETFIYISKSNPISNALTGFKDNGSTNLTIITKSMRQVMNEATRKEDVLYKQRKAKAVRDF